MSLNWNISKIANKDELWIDVVEDPMGGYRKPRPEDKPEDLCKILNPVTEAIIWLTLVIEMGDITEKNWVTFYERAKLYELYNGRYLRKYELTPKLIHRHIGLRTNVWGSVVAFNKKLKAWRKNMHGQALLSNVTWQYKP